MFEDQYSPVSLQNINNGALNEIFQEQFDKVMANIKDINVDQKATREINLKIKIYPNGDGQTARTVVVGTCKLAGIQHESAMLITDRGAYQSDPRQMDLNFDKEKSVQPEDNEQE